MNELNMKKIKVKDNTGYSIINAGRKIQDTNYFTSDLGKCNIVNLTFNAGAGRLLVPNGYKDEVLREIGTAKHVVLSLGRFYPEEEAPRMMGELMFEDFSDSPYSIHIQQEMIDRKLTSDRQKSTLLIYTEDGEYKKEFKLYIRTVPTLPCLKAW